MGDVWRQTMADPWPRCGQLYIYFMWPKPISHMWQKCGPNMADFFFLFSGCRRCKMDSSLWHWLISKNICIYGEYKYAPTEFANFSWQVWNLLYFLQIVKTLHLARSACSWWRCYFMGSVTKDYFSFFSVAKATKRQLPWTWHMELIIIIRKIIDNEKLRNNIILYNNKLYDYDKLYFIIMNFQF